MKIASAIARVGAALGLIKPKTPSPTTPKHLIPGRVANAPLRRFLARPQKQGKLRGYRKRPPLAGGMSYAQRRIEFIWASMRQANEIATARRMKRFRKVVEVNFPIMFAKAMNDLGMGDMVGSGAGLGPVPDYAGPHVYPIYTAPRPVKQGGRS